MKRIYVAGPYTHGDVAVNVRTAMLAGLEIIKAGHAPYIPHLSHFLHMQEPQPYNVWTEMDMAWVDACDVFFRLPGHSPGAEQEEIRAAYRGMPIFYNLQKMFEQLLKK